jgi:hypothetical protein
MIITTPSGDKLDLTEHIFEMCKLGDTDFRTVENTAFLTRLGQCIAMAAGSTAPHAVLVHLRDRMAPDLWSHVGYLWTEAAETPHVAE